MSKFACCRIALKSALIVGIYVSCIATGSAQAPDTSWLITSAVPLASMPPPNLPVATGANSLAAGPYAVSSGDNSTSFGYSAVASGANTSAFGSTSVASGANGVAVGMLTRATGTNTTAIGNSSNASGNNAVSLGVSSAASALNSTALGTQAVASGTNSVAIGRGSIATVADTVSFGITGGERRLTNVAAGINPTDGVNMSQLTALDTSVDTRINNAFNTFANFQGTGGISSVAIGDHAVASGPRTIGIGQNAAATGTNAVALGSGATAANAVAVGTGANAADNGAAFGNLASATGTNSTALGPAATASGPNAAAIGSGASATGTNAVALGPNAVASAPNSAAIGSGSVANQANTVSVGSVGNERRLTNVAAGSAPTDAVNVQQFQAGMSGFNSQIAATNARIDAVDQQARRGIAAASAMAPTMMPTQIGRTTVAVSAGFYRGEAALSVGVARRLNVAIPTVVFGSYANGGGSEHVGRVGVATEF
jgi:trimeric autotransporter adhesin